MGRTSGRGARADRLTPALRRRVAAYVCSTRRQGDGSTGRLHDAQYLRNDSLLSLKTYFGT